MVELPVAEPVRVKRAMGGAAMIAIAACSWGTWSLFFRPAESDVAVTPALQAFVVFSCILVLSAPLALRDRPKSRRPARAFVGLGLAGIFDALNALLFFWAMQETTLAIAVLSHYLAPVLVALGAPFVVRERLSRATWWALALALSGLCVMLEPWQSSALGSLHGALLGAGSAVFFAASLLTAKRLGKFFAPTEILAWHMPTALLTLAPFLPEGATSVGAPALLLLVIAGIGPGAVAGVLFIRGLALVAASRASILMLLEPVVAVMIGVAFFRELPRLLGVAGAGMVLLAAFMVLKNERGPHVADRLP